MATYVVQSGDTLSAIAAHFGVSLEALEAANPQIHDPNVIFVGQEINIPNGAAIQPDPGTLPDRYAEWLQFVNAAAQTHTVEPALIFGIMAVESNGFNVIGDQGHGRGLMQIDDRAFPEWIAANNGGLDPESNIMQGAKVLRANIDAFDGDVRTGVSAFNAGQGGARKGLTLFGDSDHFTTGGNYSVKVFGHAADFRNEGVA
jgi:soluble lytic murein transglycosylase-like protein